jgi:glycine/sarcosine N-methyltransferase
MSSSPEFSRLEYRRSDAWPRRREREWPFIAARLGEVPAAGPVVDLGCGSGEHVRLLAAQGLAAIGIDFSADALALGAEGAAAEGISRAPAWIRADLRRLPLAEGRARLALSLGNTLVLLGGDAEILEALREARRILSPGGALIIQILNYHKLRRSNQRYLPLNFRSEEEGELVYLRLMDFDEPEHLSFHAITLERRPGLDAVEMRRAVRRRLRSLESDGLEAALGRAGFEEIELHGDFAGASFESLSSPDVIAVARKAAG